MQKTPLFQNFILSLLLGLTAHQAMAAFTPDIGARASVAGAQELLVSPPIPNLEGGRTTYSPQTGYMVAKVVGDDTQPGSVVSYRGEVKGLSGALGVSSPSSGRLGWFGIVGGDSLTGEIEVGLTGQPTARIENIKTQSFAFAAGPSYRFIGESKSPFSAGAFLGPAAIKVSSTFNVSGSNTIYTLDDTIYGAYGGVQLKFRVDNLVINPYFLYMHDLSPSCKTMTLSDSAAGFSGMCPDEPTTPNKVEMKSSFTGFGLFLGWKALRLNIYSKALPDKAFDDVKITNYSISYTFGE